MTVKGMIQAFVVLVAIIVYMSIRSETTTVLPIPKVTKLEQKVITEQIHKDIANFDEEGYQQLLADCDRLEALWAEGKIGEYEEELAKLRSK